MGCNCGKKRTKTNNNSLNTVKKGTMGSRIKKIWKLSETNSVVIKKVDNR